MKNYILKGESIRTSAKSIVLDFMANHQDCQVDSKGLKQSEIFRGCGLDWGNQKSATSSNQQYWLVALLRSLESDGHIERVGESGPWRIR
ncbi:MAG: hypothetical protein CMF12_03585 [Idiomarina sp.]|nr:hypothetical protein [Idiomarina sp.]